jgi:hypothetical protein
MTDPFEFGDPFIEWNEENSAKEEPEKDEDGPFTIYDLFVRINDIVREFFVYSSKLITINVGNGFEEIVDVVFCQECDQWHIVSEKRKNNGHPATG